MATQIASIVSNELIEIVREFPTTRHVEHCGKLHAVSTFDVYFTCPDCGARTKLRAFSADPEFEDLFDAMLEWSKKPGAWELLIQRRNTLGE